MHEPPKLPASPMGAMLRSELFWLAAAAVIATGATGVVLFEMDVDQELGRKFIELAVQAVVVGLAGWLLAKEYLKRQAEYDSVSAFRRQLLEDLTRDYVAAKRIRRLLRAGAEQRGGGTEKSPWTHIREAEYRSFMRELNDVQLSLEVSRRRLRLYARRLAEGPELADAVKDMEKYLDELVEEFERHRRHRADANGEFALRDLPVLGGFISSKKESSFENMAGPFKTVLRSLQARMIDAGAAPTPSKPAPAPAVSE